MQNTEKNFENGNLFSNAQNAIQIYVNSPEQFPVPFEEFWQWVGYARKDNAKRMLEANFVEERDYLTLRTKAERQWIHNIYLTIDCAKSFAMLAQTETGRLIRSYFLECEKALIKIQQNSQYQLLPNEIQKILFDIEFLKKENEKHQKLHQIVNHLVNVSENRSYIPHKTATPLSKYYVYFAFNPDNGLTKIGRSQEPQNRLKTFKAISPNVDLALIINVCDVKTSCELESFLHALFAQKHQSGEIFNLSDSDFKLLEFLKDGIEAFN